MDERLSPRDERPRRPMFWAFVIFAPTALSLLVNGSWVLSGSHSYSVSSLLLAGILMLLAVLALLILQIYMMYFLTEEMRKHHNRWWRFTVGTKRELAMMGYTAGHLRNPEPLPSRGGGLYIILMFLIPFFEFYWFYTLIKDGNSHLLQQRIFENQLIELLRERPPERSSQISVISSA